MDHAEMFPFLAPGVEMIDMLMYTTTWFLLAIMNLDTLLYIKA